MCVRIVFVSSCIMFVPDQYFIFHLNLLISQMWSLLELIMIRFLFEGGGGGGGGEIASCISFVGSEYIIDLTYGKSINLKLRHIVFLRQIS